LIRSVLRGQAPELETRMGLDAIGVNVSPLGEVVRYFASSQVSAAQWEILYRVSQEGSKTGSIRNELCKGTIPFHLSDGDNKEANWNLCHDTLQEFPPVATAKRQKLKKLKETIAQEEKKLQDLQRSLQKHKEDLEELQSSMKSFSTLEATCPAMSCAAKELSLVEKGLSKAVLACIDKDPCAFSEFAENEKCSSPPPLSLVFNAVGLSPQTIDCLSDLDGQEFLDSYPMTLCDDNLITDFTQRKAVIYLHHMLSFKQIPYSKHSCVVCDCKNAEELLFLIQEHEKEDPIISAILTNDSLSITGPQFLFINRSDLCKHFLKNVSPKQFRDFKKQTLNYFWHIHKQSLSSNCFPS